MDTNGPSKGLRVLPFYVPPTLVLRQVASLLRFRSLTHWPGMSRWIPDVDRLLKVAAGAVGIGCFGFPIHPVYEVTAACNLRCRHCHASGGSPYPGELDTEGAKEVIRRIAEVPEFRMLVFTGGEPLVRRDIYELVEHAKGLGFNVVIATNATLISRGVARKLREAGVEGIAASLDFIDPAQHDEYRGLRGAFRLALRGISNAASEGLYVQVNITLSKRNLSQLEGLLRLSDRLGAHVVLLYQLIPAGRGLSIQSEALSREEFKRVLGALRAVQREIKPVVVPVGLPEYFAYLHDGSEPARLSSMVFSGCIAGRGMFYVKPNGDVWPCPFVPISAGNLLKQSALKIWRKSSVFESLRNRESLKGYCRTCKYVGVCGGCRARAYAYTGDLLASDPMCPLVAGEKEPKSDAHWPASPH